MNAIATSPGIDIVKRGGVRTSEPFSHSKLHDSVIAACLSVRTPEGEAFHIAQRVVHAVADWCQTKPEVTSHDLRRITASHLSIFHPEAAYLYTHHQLII